MRPNCQQIPMMVTLDNYKYDTLNSCKKACISESTGKCNMISRYGEITKPLTSDWHCRFYACPDPYNFTWIIQDQTGHYANECNTYILPLRHFTIESRYINITNIINKTQYNKYQIKEFGTNTCPKGFSQITNIYDCKSAQLSVAKDKSFQGIPHPSSPVSGCYYDTLHNRVYMPPESHGTGSNHMAPICEATCEILKNIIINKTNIVNKTVWKEKIRWRDKINIINKTVWKEKIRWRDKINIINKTRIINKINNITNWINKTVWKEKIRWRDKIIWKDVIIYTEKRGKMCGIELCNYCDNKGCCTSDVNGSICKNENPDAIQCEKPYPCDESENNDRGGAILGYSIVGVIGFLCFVFLLYFFCNDYLKDKIQSYIDEKCCCGLCEYIMCINDCICFFKDAVESNNESNNEYNNESNSDNDVEDDEKHINLEIREYKKKTVYL